MITLNQSKYISVIDQFQYHLVEPVFYSYVKEILRGYATALPFKYFLELTLENINQLNRTLPFTVLGIEQLVLKQHYKRFIIELKTKIEYFQLSHEQILEFINHKIEIIEK